VTLRIVPPFRIKHDYRLEAAPKSKEMRGGRRHYQFLVLLAGRRSRMNKNTSFSLGEHFADFVESQVARGRYGSASEVVRAGLRLLEDQEAQLAVLRAALVEGETSGASSPFDFDAFVMRKRRNHAGGGE
jgi:antitoxin ParD1/3/4